MADVEEQSVPVLAVTAAVGAVVLLLVLLCGVGRKQEPEEQKEEGKNLGSSQGNTLKTDVKMCFHKINHSTCRSTRGGGGVLPTPGILRMYQSELKDFVSHKIARS